MIRKTAFVPGLLAIACLSVSMTAFAGDKDAPPPPHANNGFVSAVFSQSDIKDVLTTIFIQSHVNYAFVGDLHGLLTLRIDHKPWNDVADVIGKIEGLSIAQNEIGVVTVKSGLPAGTINSEPALGVDPNDGGSNLGMQFESANAMDVLNTIAIQGSLNLVVPDLAGAPPVTLQWTGVSAKNALVGVAEIIGYSVFEHQGIFFLMKK